MVQGNALLLGGGGVTGVAWETGILAGLSDAGVDLSSAELLVGTSAGAAVAAQLASGMPLDELLQRQRAGAVPEILAAIGPTVMVRYLWAMLTRRDAAAYGRAMGRLALGATTVSEPERRTVIAARLPSHDWPDRPLMVTSVNARTGEFRVFDRQDRVSLVDAVAASCAIPGVWPPVTIEGERWIDGGMRSAVNADLAQGRARVVVLAPITSGFRAVPSVSRQVGALGVPASWSSARIERQRHAWVATPWIPRCGPQPPTRAIDRRRSSSTGSLRSGAETTAAPPRVTSPSRRVHPRAPRARRR